MDGSVREPVAAHPPISVFSPPSIACGDKHVADSGGDATVPYAFHYSFPVCTEEPSLLRGPQAVTLPLFPTPQGQQCPLKSPLEHFAAAVAPCSGTEEFVESSRLLPGCTQAILRAQEAPSLPGNNQAMPRAAASFSFEEKDAAEPPAIDGSHSPRSWCRTGRDETPVSEHQQQEQSGNANASTGCCLFEDKQQQESCLATRTSPSRPADEPAAAAAAPAAASPPLPACAPDAASRLTSEVTLVSAQKAGVTSAAEVSLAAVNKACAATQGHLESPNCRIGSMNGSTYAAYEDDGGSQSLPSPGVDWAEAGVGAAAAGGTDGSDGEGAADVAEEVGAGEQGMVSGEGVAISEGRRSHRSGRVLGRVRSSRNIRPAAAIGAVPGVAAAPEARRRGDGRIPTFRRGKAKRRSNKSRDGRRQQQQPLRLTPEVLMQLEARTSRVETTVAATGESVVAGGRGGSSLSFFWMVKQRAEQSREAAGDARRLAAFQRAERAAGGGGSSATEAAAAAAAAATAADECSSQSQRSSEVSTKGTVNHRCREDDVLINLCENPSDLWYGLRTQDGKPVVVHARPRHHSRRPHRQRRPPVPVPDAGAVAGAAAHQQAAAAVPYYQQRVQQQQHLMGSTRAVHAPLPVEQPQHRQHRRPHRNRSQKDLTRRQSGQRSSSQLPVHTQGASSPSFISVQHVQRQRANSMTWQLQPLQQLQHPMPPQQQVQFQQQQQMLQQQSMQQQQLLQHHRIDRKRRHKERKRGHSSSSSAAATAAGTAVVPQQQQQQQQGPSLPQQLFFSPAPSKDNRRSERRRRFHANRGEPCQQAAGPPVQQQGKQPDRVVYVHSPEPGGSSRAAPSPRISSHHQLGLALPPPASSAQPWAVQSRSRGLPQRVSAGAEETANAHQSLSTPFILGGQQQQNVAAAGEALQLFRPARRPRLDDGSFVFSSSKTAAVPSAVAASGGWPWGAASEGSAATAASTGQGVFKPPAPLSASQKALAKRRGLATRLLSTSGGIAGQSSRVLPSSHGATVGLEVNAEAAAPPACGVASAAGPSAVDSSSSSSSEQHQQQQHPLSGVARPVHSYGDLDAAGRLAQHSFRVVLGGGCSTVFAAEAVHDPAASAEAATGQMGLGYSAPPSVQAKQSRRMTARERVQWQLAKSRGML